MLQVQGGSADAGQLYEVVTAQLEAMQRLTERLRVLWMQAELPGSFPKPVRAAGKDMLGSASSASVYATPGSAASSRQVIASCA